MTIPNGALYAANTLATILLVTLLALPGCGSDEGPAVQTELTSTVELGEGSVAEIVPGVVRERDVDPPVLWASAPRLQVTISTGSSDPDPITLQLQNLPPEVATTVESAETIPSNDVPGCPDETSQTLDCEAGNEPACDAPAVSDVSGSASTVKELTADLPACVRVTYGLTLPTPQQRPLRVAVVGATSTLERLRTILGDIEQRDSAGEAVDWIVLTGDHAEQRNPESLDQLESALAGRAVPLMVLRGETERLRNAQVSFRPRFGPISMQFSVGEAAITSFDSATRVLNGLSVEALNDRLDAAASGPRVALTHTPLFDPENLRDGGFRSELEAARILAILEQTGTSTLLAGHVPTRGRLQRGSVDIVTASASASPGYTLVSVSTTTGAAEIDIERVDL
jgi:hypothetical protein